MPVLMKELKIGGDQNFLFLSFMPKINVFVYTLQAWKKWSDGTPLDLLDMNLRDSYSRVEVMRCIHVGLCCVQEDPVQRPTMQTIVLMLNSHSITLEPPERPAGYISRTHQSLIPTKEFDNSDKSTTTNQSASASVDDASITQVYPR